MDNKKSFLASMPDAAEYPKTIAAQQFFAGTAHQAADTLAEQLRNTAPDQKLVKKGLGIAKNIAGICATFTEHTYGDVKTIKEYLEKRQNMLKKIGIFQEYSEALSLCESADDVGMFLVFAHVTCMLHINFIDRNVETIKRVYENGKPEAAFESNIIIDTMFDIMRKWDSWYKENGTIPFEKYSHDVHPADNYRNSESSGE